MTHAEWQSLDSDFHYTLLRAYHAWKIGNETSDVKEKDVANSLLDKRMKEAYAVRSQYIHVTSEG